MRVRMSCRAVVLVLLLGTPGLAQDVALAGPTQHWLFDRPVETQTRIINIRLRAVDLDGNALPAGTVLQAHCAPWDYAFTLVFTDPGEVSFRGPVGDWLFMVGADLGTGRAVLAARGRVKLVDDADLEIGPEREIRLQYLRRTSGRGGSRATRRETEPLRAGSISLITTEVPGPAQALPLGRLGDRGLDLQVTPGIHGHLWLVDTPEPERPGYALLSRYLTGASDAAVFSPSDLGQLTLDFAGYAAHDIWADIYLTPAGGGFIEQAAARVLVPVPPGGVTYRLDVTPGKYHLYMILSQGLKEVCACLGYYLLDLKPGQQRVLPFGNRFVARPQVCQWDDTHLHLWFDINDDQGNSLLYYNQPTSLWLGKGRTELYHGGSSAPLGERWYEVARPWGTPADRAGVAYRFGTSCPLFGELTAEGALNADQILLEALPEIAGSEHFVVRCRDDAPEVAQLIADTLQGAFVWTATQYAGPIRTAQGQPFDVCGVTRTGMQWASNNDRIGLPVSFAQLPYDLTGDCLRALLHEFGHLYEANAPHHLAPQLTDYRMSNGGSLENEAQATLTADLCLRAARGEAAYHWARQRDAVLFFDWKTGRAACPDEHDRYLFILHYLADTYGQGLHRDYMGALHGSEGAWVEPMLADPSLRTIHDRMAVIYSFLTGDNVAWLFRWAGFPVADQTVQTAVARLRAAGYSPPER